MPILRQALENPIRDKVCHDALHILGVRSLQLNLRHDSGWPDRLFLVPRMPMFLEFKRPGDRPRQLQLERLQLLTDLGYLESVDHGWADNYETAMARIRTALARR